MAAPPNTQTGFHHITFFTNIPYIGNKGKIPKSRRLCNQTNTGIYLLEL